MLFFFFIIMANCFFFLQNVNRLAKFTTLRSKQCRNLIKPFKNKCLNYFFFRQSLLKVIMMTVEFLNHPRLLTDRLMLQTSITLTHCNILQHLTFCRVFGLHNAESLPSSFCLWTALMITTDVLKQSFLYMCLKKINTTTE